MNNVKKLITMILTIALAITAVTVPSNKANAEETPGYTPQMPAVTPPPWVSFTPVQPGTVVTPAPIPTERPTPPMPTERPRTYFIEVRDTDDPESWNKNVTRWLRMLTVGFTREMRLEDNVMAVWTSDRPDIAAVDKSGPANRVTVKGKKSGTAVITAEYNGIKSHITINVMKNEYKKKLKPSHSKDIKSDGDIITSDFVSGITSVKFDKKGNLKCTYMTMTKMNKSQYKKAKKNGAMEEYNPKNPYHLTSVGGRKLIIRDLKNKTTLLEIKVTNEDRDNYCCKDKKRLCHSKGVNFYYKLGLNKPRYIKFTIKKKYLKKLKGVDWNRCHAEFL